MSTYDDPRREPVQSGPATDSANQLRMNPDNCDQIAKEAADEIDHDLNGRGWFGLGRRYLPIIRAAIARAVEPMQVRLGKQQDQLAAAQARITELEQLHDAAMSSVRGLEVELERAQARVRDMERIIQHHEGCWDKIHGALPQPAGDDPRSLVQRIHTASQMTFPTARL